MTERELLWTPTLPNPLLYLGNDKCAQGCNPSFAKQILRLPIESIGRNGR